MSNETFVAYPPVFVAPQFYAYYAPIPVVFAGVRPKVYGPYGPVHVWSLLGH